MKQLSFEPDCGDRHHLPQCHSEQQGGTLLLNVRSESHLNSRRSHRMSRYLRTGRAVSLYRESKYSYCCLSWPLPTHVGVQNPFLRKAQPSGRICYCQLQDQHGVIAHSLALAPNNEGVLAFFTFPMFYPCCKNIYESMSKENPHI
jgi:hypothetical protein